MSFKEGLSPEDLELWLHINQDIKPLAVKKKLGIKAKDLKRSFYPSPNKLSFPKPNSLPNILDSLHPSFLNNQTLGRKIKKHQLFIEGRLDLHGLTQGQAYQELLDFIDQSQLYHKRCVLVITGKGSSLSTPGVLKQHVPLWLSTSPLKEKVISFSYAHSQHGGQGALYIHLRKHVAF